MTSISGPIDHPVPHFADNHAVTAPLAREVANGKATRTLPKLYDIVTSITEILDATDDEGELLPGAEERLEALGLDLAVKADNVARYVMHLQAEHEAYAHEVDRLERLARSAHNRAQRLKAYLKFNLERAGLTKLDTALFKIAIQRNSTPSCRLVNPDTIPDEYAKTVTTVSLDTPKVIADWKAKKDLPPGLTVEVGNHLRIR